MSFASLRQLVNEDDGLPKYSQFAGMVERTESQPGFAFFLVRIQVPLGLDFHSRSNQYIVSTHVRNPEDAALSAAGVIYKARGTMQMMQHRGLIITQFRKNPPYWYQICDVQDVVPFPPRPVILRTPH